MRASLPRTPAPDQPEPAELSKLRALVTDMLEQLDLGNWRDDHDHDVRMNEAVIDLRRRVEVDGADAIRARSDQPAPEPVALCSFCGKSTALPSCGLAKAVLRGGK